MGRCANTGKHCCAQDPGKLCGPTSLGWWTRGIHVEKEMRNTASRRVRTSCPMALVLHWTQSSSLSVADDDGSFLSLSLSLHETLTLLLLLLLFAGCRRVVCAFLLSALNSLQGLRNTSTSGPTVHRGPKASKAPSGNDEKTTDALDCSLHGNLTCLRDGHGAGHSWGQQVLGWRETNRCKGRCRETPAPDRIRPIHNVSFFVDDGTARLSFGSTIQWRGWRKP